MLRSAAVERKAERERLRLGALRSDRHWAKEGVRRGLGVWREATKHASEARAEHASRAEKAQGHESQRRLLEGWTSLVAQRQLGVAAATVAARRAEREKREMLSKWRAAVSRLRALDHHSRRKHPALSPLFFSK
jgi:hypothetical protein